MIDNQQWKSGGDCSICRRKEYCTKGCKAYGRRNQRMIAEAFAKTEVGKIANMFIDEAEMVGEQNG